MDKETNPKINKNKATILVLMAFCAVLIGVVISLVGRNNRLIEANGNMLENNDNNISVEPIEPEPVELIIINDFTAVLDYISSTYGYDIDLMAGLTESGIADLMRFAALRDSANIINEFAAENGIDIQISQTEIASGDASDTALITQILNTSQPFALVHVIEGNSTTQIDNRSGIVDEVIERWELDRELVEQLSDGGAVELIRYFAFLECVIDVNNVLSEELNYQLHLSMPPYDGDYDKELINEIIATITNPDFVNILIFE